jgi:hypothetical protein
MIGPRRTVIPAAILALAAAGCGVLPPEMFGYGTDDRPLIMDSGGELEPLEEVVPPDASDGAQVLFLDLGEGPVSIEGEVTMVRLTTDDGTVIADHRLPRDGRVVHHALSPGDYQVDGYYRVCDGNCGYLDPPEPLCSTQVSLVADKTYLVEIGVISGCKVTEDDD